QAASLDGVVSPAGVDVLVDARQAERLAGPGEHAGALGYQILDAGPRGGGVVEDFDCEAVCGQRGRRPLQALRGRRGGEQCCRGGGGHGASLAGRGGAGRSAWRCGSVDADRVAGWHPEWSGPARCDRGTEKRVMMSLSFRSLGGCSSEQYDNATLRNV